MRVCIVYVVREVTSFRGAQSINGHDTFFSIYLVDNYQLL